MNAAKTPLKVGAWHAPVTHWFIHSCLLSRQSWPLRSLCAHGAEHTPPQLTSRSLASPHSSLTSPLAAGSFDLFLNLQIALVIAMQLAMCLFCAIANYVWIQQEGKKRYYLALDVYVQGNWENAGAQICLTFLTFWILLSYLVPISLFVTLEIVKFIQVGGWLGWVHSTVV